MKVEYLYQIGDELKTVTVEGDDGGYRVSIGANTYHFTVKQLGPGFINLETAGQQVQAYIAHRASQRYVAVAGQTWLMERQTAEQAKARRGKSVAGTGLDSLKATMPGVVVEVLVTGGDHVERGQSLVLLEAMKMELRVSAPCAGHVRTVHCTPGQVMERGQSLVDIEAD
jgi:biotin carboxyl carrier protein